MVYHQNTLYYQGRPITIIGGIYDDGEQDYFLVRYDDVQIDLASALMGHLPPTDYAPLLQIHGLHRVKNMQRGYSTRYPCGFS